MAEEPKNDLRDQLLAVAESVVKVADMISSPAAKDKQSDDVAIPQKFFCPLSNVLLADPVMLSSGQTYDRFAIENWLQSGKKICPVTKETLSDSSLMPNHIARVLIRDWCKKHNKSHLLQYSILTPLYIRQEYFGSLHMKLCSKSSEDQKEAAKEVRKEATKWPYFRKLYAELPDAIPHLLAPLSQSDENSEIAPQLQEDLITTLMIVSVDDKVKKVVAESPNGIPVLLEALQSDNTETQRNAVLTIFQISSIDSNKKIIGKTDAMVKLATLLMGNRRKVLSTDVTKTLLRLFQNKENKAKAVKEFARGSIFQKIEESEYVDAMLPVLGSLLSTEEGIKEIEKYGCDQIFRVIRESFSAQDKEYGTGILFYVLRKDGLKWKEMIAEEELTNGTVSEISQNGSTNAKKMAKAMLDWLNMKPFTEDTSSSTY